MGEASLVFGETEDLKPKITHDVFINHRGVDTKRNIAGLLYDRFVQLDIKAFLDERSMGPGDKLHDSIESAIDKCRVGIVILSPRYCESFFCLHELALMIESGKKIIPIFYNIKPSELDIVEIEGNVPPEKLEGFSRALRQVRCTVGITFDSQNGNWSELISRTVDAVQNSLNNETY
ncbi:TMV resistance protein N-like [Phalaenopsis equestris]|uniref:TMV resistance protein N-like n=1 Tax=Phalaenopsis equestris TaxID=78828 RepID=UPI0009E1CCF1|nr:TMV resistance protein N-like [Phalaenopsis equestris]